MKQIFTSIALIAMAISLSSCEKEVICNCNCQCNNSENSGQAGNRPGNNDGTDNGGSNNGGSNDDNTGSGDRSEYETYNNTFTQANAGYYGVYYEGQPSNVSNWYLEMADNNYDMENYEGTGFNIVLEFFASGTSSTSLPTGKYTVEAFDRSEYSAGSLLYGYVGEDEDGNQYPAGTWFFEGDDGVAAATAGELTVEKSGSTYTIKYRLYDDEYQIEFSGSFTGTVTIYDGTQSYSNAPAMAARKAPRGNTKYYRVRR